MFPDLCGDFIDKFAGVFEWHEDFLCIVEPLCVDLEHSMEIPHILDMFF